MPYSGDTNFQVVGEVETRGANDRAAEEPKQCFTSQEITELLQSLGHNEAYGFGSEDSTTTVLGDAPDEERGTEACQAACDMINKPPCNIGCSCNGTNCHCYCGRPIPKPKF